MCVQFIFAMQIIHILKTNAYLVNKLSGMTAIANQLTLGNARSPGDFEPSTKYLFKSTIRSQSIDREEIYFFCFYFSHSLSLSRSLNIIAFYSFSSIVHSIENAQSKRSKSGGGDEVSEHFLYSNKVKRFRCAFGYVCVFFFFFSFRLFFLSIVVVAVLSSSSSAFRTFVYSTIKA